MPVFSAVIGLLSSLPQILKLIQTMSVWFQKVSGGDLAGFLDKTNNAFELLHKAQTDQEVIDAAKALQNAIRGTRS